MKEFESSHFLLNKPLNFGHSDIIDCDDGVYDFVDLNNEDLDYNEEKTSQFDKVQRGAGSSEVKKTNSLSFFQKEAIDKCVQGPILSVGCGSMYWDQRFVIDLPFFPLDISKFMLQDALRKGRTKFGIAADGTNLPFSDNQFELTYCIDALPSALYGGLESRFIRKKMLNEMLRVTMKKGRIVLLLPNRNKTKFNNIIKFKKFRGVRHDEYGFLPRELYDELVRMGFEIDHYSYKMCVSPFRDRELIIFWNSLISFLRLNFLGMIFIVIKV